MRRGSRCGSGPGSRMAPSASASRQRRAARSKGSAARSTEPLRRLNPISCSYGFRVAAFMREPAFWWQGGAAAAAASGADLVIMDDGLQNPSLAKDFRIAVVDGRRGIGNGRVFPAGPLRAPLSAQFDRVDVLLVVGAATASTDDAVAAAQK